MLFSSVQEVHALEKPPYSEAFLYLYHALFFCTFISNRPSRRFFYVWNLDEYMEKLVLVLLLVFLIISVLMGYTIEPLLSIAFGILNVLVLRGKKGIWDVEKTITYKPPKGGFFISV